MRYILRRSAKNITVRIGGGNFLVSAPRGATAADVERVIAYFKQKHPNYEELLRQSVRPDGILYLHGQKITVQDAKIADNSYKNLEKVFARYKEYYMQRTAELCRFCGTKVTSVTFSKFRSKWGSMDSLGRLKLNKLIFMLENSLSDYLIIHELCHTKQMNHSKKFWQQVEKYLPDYKKRRQELKKQGYLLSIFV